MFRILALLSFLVATVASATVTPLPGSTPQTAALGSTFAVAPRLLVTGSFDVPVPKVGYEWRQPWGIGTIPTDGCYWNDAPVPYGQGFFCAGQTDESGIIQLPLLVAGRVGVSYITVVVGNNLGSATIELTVEGKPITQGGQFSIQDMWWSGREGNGWGMSVAQHGDSLFNVVYAYDDAGEPTWFVMPDGSWDIAVGYSNYHGPIYSPRSSPFFAYEVTRFVPGPPVGYLDLSFDSRQTDFYLRLEDFGDSVMTSIERQDFSGDIAAPITGLGGMWWGGAEQNGWGIAIMEQKGGLFAVWLTYDAAGKPTWFVMPSGQWSNSGTYSGSIYRTHGSAWLNGAYDASKLQANVVGSFTFNFAVPGRATFDFTVDDKGGTLSLGRQPFGADQ